MSVKQSSKRYAIHKPDIRFRNARTALGTFVRNKGVLLLRVSGQVGIAGNEQVDLLTKLGVKVQCQCTQPPIGLNKPHFAMSLDEWPQAASIKTKEEMLLQVS